MLSTKGLSTPLLVVLGQFGAALLGLGLLGRETVVPHDELGQLRAAESLVAVVQDLVVADHLHAGGGGADFEQCDQLILAGIGQAADQPTGGKPCRVRFDVDDQRLQAGRLGQALAVLHLFLARSGDQHLDVAGGRAAGADHAEVQAHFIERERDVLVGFGLDLDLQVLLGQAARQDNLLGDHRRGRQRHRNIARAGAALLDDAPHRLGDLVELLDVAVVDPAALQGLDGATLQDVPAVLPETELDELDAG
jgi:hypothetical protein